MFKKKRSPDEPPAIGSLDYKIQVCEQYIKLWQSLFQFFAESLVDKTITDQEEKEFGRLVYQATYNHFKFTRMMGRDFGQAKNIMKILTQCVNLRHLQRLPEATFSSLQIEWHEAFIGMNKTLGSLLAQLPPEEPIEEADRKAKKATAKAGAKTLKKPEPPKAPAKPAPPKPVAPKPAAKKPSPPSPPPSS